MLAFVNQRQFCLPGNVLRRGVDEPDLRVKHYAASTKFDHRDVAEGEAGQAEILDEIGRSVVVGR